MASLPDELLAHQYIYVPWVKKAPAFEMGAPLAVYLRDNFRRPLTVVCPQRSNAPEALARAEVVTERSGRVVDGGVVLAYCPTFKLMSKIAHLDRSVVVLVEWATESFAGWAKLVGPYNVITGSVMDAGLSEEGHEALNGILFEGYKGWHDSIAVRMTTSHLAELAELGQYNREVVLAHARSERGEDGIKRLYGILDTFDASLQ